MYINLREYHPNDLGESIGSPKKIYRSLSAFIGGNFQLHKSGEPHLPYLAFSCFHTESPAKAVIRDESGERFFTYDDDDKPRSALFFYHPDHIGSTTFVSDAQGREYEHIEYTPYGETWLNTRRGNDDDHDDDEWDWDDDEGSPIRWRFTGKEIDPETGLQYFGARYQDPRTSRWISSDPAGPELMVPMDDEGKLRSGYSVIEALNWYSYGANNPVKFVDPTGMEITVQAHLVRLGNYHLSIKITPENQENYKNDKRFKNNIDAAGNHYVTLGANRAKGRLLVSNINRKTDINNPKVETIPLDLKGQDEDAVIADLLEADSNYQDDAEYNLFPQEDEPSGHNSNSYISGLLKAVGLDPPDVKSNTPGYDKPLPDINFYRDSWMPPNNEEE